MDIESLFQHVPFVDHLGIEVHEAADGYAAGSLDLRPELSSNPGNQIAHGGVTFSLADTIGGAAVVSRYEAVCPTVDMRIDYLAPATDDLYAEAELQKEGGNVAVAEVDVYDSAARETDVAVARGVYKTGGQGEDTPWTDGVDADDLL